VIHWVLEFQPIGARGFITASQEEADELCRAQADYPASFRVTQIHCGVVTVTYMKIDNDVNVQRGDIVRLCRQLHKHKITDAYCERRQGRRVPFGTLVKSGPLAGMFHVSISAVVAGSDGDY